jgi:ribulose kinase
MAKLTKKAKEAASKLKNRMYSLKDAAALIKVVLQNDLLMISRTFGCRSKKANQMVRGVVTRLMELVKMLKY